MAPPIGLDDSRPKAILVGISGVSSSGKTTLARLLRDVFSSHAFILHEDDFYKPDAEIPVNSKGVADWDCLEAIDLPALEQTLRYIREHGRSPPDFVSKEDQNSVGRVVVDTAVLTEIKARANEWFPSTAGSSGDHQSNDSPPKIAIVDGFLLYSDAMKSVREQFDIKLFLRTDHITATTRREARAGYVTLEGFWVDPPGYVDEVVWPNYVQDHAFLFEDGNVEGALRQQVLDELQIDAVADEARTDMTKCLQWAYNIIDRYFKANVHPTQ